MKRILITGKNSYIGNSFKKWVSQWPEQFETHLISVRGDEWKKLDFSNFDVVLHCAGIAHVSANPQMEQEYYKVNRDLAIEIAEKAKKEKVKQFIFMSSIIIYGADGKIGEKKVITADTKPEPVDFYGKSKLEADIAIQKLNSEDFKTVIVRTPMVYGPNCKGNFPKLIKLAKVTPVFPNIDNERSMIFIDNLCEFLKQVIVQERSGVFYPQNKEYISTKDIIKIVANAKGRRVIFTKLFNPLIRLASKRINILNKALGNKVYDKNLSSVDEYNVVEFEESINKSIAMDGYNEEKNSNVR